MASGCSSNSLLAEVFLFVSLVFFLFFCCCCCCFVFCFLLFLVFLCFLSFFVEALSLSQVSQAVFAISFSNSYQHFDSFKDAAATLNRICPGCALLKLYGQHSRSVPVTKCCCYLNSSFLLELCLELTT